MQDKINENQEKQIFEPIILQEQPIKQNNYFIKAIVYAVWAIIFSFIPCISFVAIAFSFINFVNGTKFCPKKTSYRWAIGLNILAIGLSLLFLLVYASIL